MEREYYQAVFVWDDRPVVAESWQSAGLSFQTQSSVEVCLHKERERDRVGDEHRVSGVSVAPYIPRVSDL